MSQGKLFTPVIWVCFGNMKTRTLAGSSASSDERRAAGAEQSSTHSARGPQLILRAKEAKDRSSVRSRVVSDRDLFFLGMSS